MNRTQTAAPAVHPLGTDARVLLSSVFGPYARDDDYGSRKVNPMELYHNQVTRVQGPFSLRIFHPSFGLMMLQANMEAPCTLLDFPRLDDFIGEIRENHYDIVGISSIIPNVGKVKKMCEEVRAHLPRATIVIGGHVANIPHLNDLIDADHIVRGDGVRWFRRFLGQDTEAPIHHPVVDVRFGSRTLGLPIPDGEKDPVAALIPSVGCPVGCNFCSTSAMFGGKGKFVDFYENGESLFSVMCQLEEKLKTQSFFVFDENFLLHRRRSLRLLELIEENGKSWSFYTFSSARVLESYTIEQLVRLGISWVWMGLEGEDSRYRKLGGVDTRALVKKLQSHGIGVLGSTIIGLENHTPENIDEIIKWAVDHETDFHQFMLYTPLPGTPLYEEHASKGTLLPEEECSLADIHGQERFNFVHPHIKEGRENQFLLRAFLRDLEINGPSIARTIRTRLQGWLRYKHHADLRVRRRFERDMENLRTTYAAAVYAMKKWYRNDLRMSDKMGRILQDLYREFGWKTRIFAPVAGNFAYAAIRREARRLAEGWTYEPAMRLLKNAKALALDEGRKVHEWLQIPGIQRVTTAPPVAAEQ